MKKKIWANFQRIIKFLPKKNGTKLSKIWVWHPGSEIRDPRSGIRKKTYSGSRIQGSKRHLIPDPQHLCCISGMFIPDPNFFHSGSRIPIKEFNYFNPKIFFFAHGFGSGFFTHPDRGSFGQKAFLKKATGPGSATLVNNCNKSLPGYF
jgi:hypothetical protein